MSQKSSNILVSIYRNAKKECLKNPIATGSAVFGILGAGLAYLFRQYVIKAIGITVKTNIFLLILSLVSLATALAISRSAKYPKVECFTIGQHKWKTKIFKDGTFEVEKYPFCVTHDLRLIERAIGLACPRAAEEDCHNYIEEVWITDKYEVAKSTIEKIIKNRKC